MNLAALQEDVSAETTTLPRREKGALVRLLTCGSVDDGKSTLIGRLLWDAAGVTEDQRAAITLASHNRAVNGEKIDFSLLLDGLQAEREQGITIDIAWRYFETPDRRFIIIDSPGHEQYTRNMATGASHADIAILLVDARHGAKRQTRRHAAICDLVGIKKVVLAVNKMDAVDWSEARYREIEADFRAMAGSFNFAQVTTIPVAALTGDNVVYRSTAMPWYAGPTLLDYLEAVDPEAVTERRAVPHAGAARAARLGRFPRLCRHGHLGADQRRRADRRCQKRARRHAQAHRHHGRRPHLGGQGRRGHAGARHRSRHLPRRGAVGGAPPSHQCRRDRGAAGVAVGDAVRSGSGLSAPHRHRSHPGDQHERVGAGRFRDAGRRSPRMLAASTTSPIAASCSGAPRQ